VEDNLDSQAASDPEEALPNPAALRQEQPDHIAAGRARPEQARSVVGSFPLAAGSSSAAFARISAFLSHVDGAPGTSRAGKSRYMNWLDHFGFLTILTVALQFLWFSDWTGSVFI